MTKKERAAYSKILNVSVNASEEEIIQGYRSIMINVLRRKLGIATTDEDLDYFNAYNLLMNQFNLEDEILNQIANQFLEKSNSKSLLFSHEENELIQYFPNEILKISKNHQDTTNYNYDENRFNLKLSLSLKLELDELKINIENYFRNQRINPEELKSTIIKQSKTE
jgi:hypothetical protein